MKKGIIIFSALSLLAVISCKKEHTCSCKVETSGSPFGNFSIVVDTVYTDMKKKDAEFECNKGDLTYNFNGVSSSSECELK